MKKIFNTHVITIVLAILFGALSGIWATYLTQPEQTSKTEQDLIREFYEVENAVHVSPHGIRKHMTQGNQSAILVDLRSQEEYETAHISGALSVPAYMSPDKSAYDDVDRIVNSFKKIQEENPGQEIIVYCYSTACMTGRKIGKMLVEHDIYVKHLGIGWQEWRYYWDLWNHDGETKVNPEDYISIGPEPGQVKTDGPEFCPLEGEFGC